MKCTCAWIENNLTEEIILKDMRRICSARLHYILYVRLNTIPYMKYAHTIHNWCRLNNVHTCSSGEGEDLKGMINISGWSLFCIGGHASGPYCKPCYFRQKKDSRARLLLYENRWHFKATRNFLHYNFFSPKNTEAFTWILYALEPTFSCKFLLTSFVRR